MICYNPFIRHSSEHFGGPDGEAAASLRYLSQRFAMPYKEGIATLTDTGTEELAHLEIVCAIIHQLTRNLSPEEIKKQGFAEYYVDHTLGIWPQAAGGIPLSSTFFQSKGDPITDLHEDLAAEQKARTTYDNILRLTDDPDVLDPIRFLRAREVVHFQRFGETLRIVQEHLDSRNFYAYNPAFDCGYQTAFGDASKQYRRCTDCETHEYSRNLRSTDCPCTNDDNTREHSSNACGNCEYASASRQTDCNYSDRRQNDCGHTEHTDCCSEHEQPYPARRSRASYNGNTGRIIKN